MTLPTPRSTTPMRRLWCALALLLVAAPAALAQEQVPRSELPAFLFDPTYYSSRAFEKKAVMDGNDIRFTFFNTGLLGGLGEVRANWPAGTDNTYIGDVLPIVVAEFPVRRSGRPDTLLVNAVTVRGPRAGIEAEGPPGQTSIFWGFEAKPGFAPNQFVDPACRASTGAELNDRPAISTDPCTWPAFWPDQPTWTSPGTGRADWNGYFGQGVFNADYETYFWVDDVGDAEPQFLAQQVGGTFRADSLRPDLQSLGLVMKVRGMTWSNFLAKDTQFWLYEVTNTSTTTYPRVAVGATAGVCVGGVGSNFTPCQRDIAFFDQGNRIVYAWDATGLGGTGQRTGYVGFAFLETPGNPYNGIDDDGDGDPFTAQGLDVDGIPYVQPAELAGQNNVFTAADFQPRLLRVGDPIIVVDYNTFERRIEYLGTDPIQIPTPRGTLTAAPGMSVQERQITVQGYILAQTVTESNGVDENFNGLIDEDVNLHFERRFETIEGTVATLPPLRYKDWVGFANALVTDRAPSGAVLATRQPTRQDSMRYGLLNPRIDEVRLDPTDVTQSDQVGLTSFYYFTPPGALRMNQDRDIWRAMTPSFFTTNQELSTLQGAGGTDGNFIFGSGYFPMPPGRTLFFSLAFVFGQDLEAIRFNTETMQEIYNRNYQFTQPPIRPTLNAVAGDRKVTLYWDSASLDTRDPVLGDASFEGYRIFRSTDPFFQNVEWVTDVRGRNAHRVPRWQFDLSNGVRGLYVSADARTRGAPFPLGEDTGLRFSVEDTEVNNGQRYYYAITAYNAGSPDFYPAENNLLISVREDGSVVTGSNVVEVIPNAPVAGYEAATLSSAVAPVRGEATGGVFAEVLSPMMVPEGAEYSVTFSGGSVVAADSFVVRNNAGTRIATGRIDRSESYVFDGIRLRFTNVQPRIESTTYTQGGVNKRQLRAAVPQSNAFNGRVGWQLFGQPIGYDYEIRFSDDFTGQSEGGFRIGTGNSAPLAVARPTNFTVFNLTLGRPSPFVLCEAPVLPTGPGCASLNAGNGRFERGDLILIYEDLDPNTPGLEPTYYIGPAATGDPTAPYPGSGDVLTLRTLKPFTARDEFRFGADASAVDAEAASAALDRIRVVPNPYVAAAAWERPLPQTIDSGRGERRIDFTNLPLDATVRIYSVRGALVWEGRHDGGFADGTVRWDLRSREGLDVAYGVYFWHVSSPAGDRTGKLALIK
jgi:hypothetical protein